jgi:hypothetical protein
MARITITLQPKEKTALRLLAERERRDPRAQAALIIRYELERIGLLAHKSQPTIEEVAHEQPANPAP